MSSTFSGKFGDDIPNIQSAHEIFIQIQNLGISLYGINFHCGSATNESLSFGKAIDLAQECMKIGRQYSHKMEILDVGAKTSLKQQKKLKIMNQVIKQQQNLEDISVQIHAIYYLEQ